MTNTEIIQAIRNEIERLKTVQLKRIQEGDLVDAEPYDKNEAYNGILSFLDTLESEKPMNQKGLEREIERCLWKLSDDPSNEELCMFARHFAQWGAKHLADDSKTSPNDLEEAAVDIADALLDKPKDYVLSAKADYWNGAHDGIIAGAKWQAEHTPLPEDTVLFSKGVEEGKRLMMGEAVEGEVVKDWDNNLSVKSGVICGFKFGEKVRVIVLPKED